MHRAFGGTSLDVTCGACGHVSVAHDPTVGLSLDLPTTTRGPGPGVTLEACLRLMTRPERLGAGEAFACAACGDAEGAKWKQMAIRETPRTLALQLKRFARSSFRPGKLPVQADSDANAANVANASNASNARGAANKSTATKGGKQNKGGDAASAGGSKIVTHVSFPFTLDIAPARASAALRARYGNRAVRSPGTEDGPEGPERSVDASGTASGGASGSRGRRNRMSFSPSSTPGGWTAATTSRTRGGKTRGFGATTTNLARGPRRRSRRAGLPPLLRASG